TVSADGQSRRARIGRKAYSTALGLTKKARSKVSRRSATAISAVSSSGAAMPSTGKRSARPPRAAMPSHSPAACASGRVTTMVLPLSVCSTRSLRHQTPAAGGRKSVQRGEDFLGTLGTQVLGQRQPQLIGLLGMAFALGRDHARTIRHRNETTQPQLAV